MARPRTTPLNGAPPTAARQDGPLTVTVTVSGKVHTGLGGTFDAGAVIPVTPEQAEGLRRQGYAE